MAKAKACEHRFSVWEPVKKSASGLNIVVRKCSRCSTEERRLK